MREEVAHRVEGVPQLAVGIDHVVGPLRLARDRQLGRDPAPGVGLVHAAGRRPFDLGPLPAGDDDHARSELGDLLFAIVNVARHLRIDPELALRDASDKFRVRFEAVERLARDRSIDLRAADLQVLDELWDEVKLGQPGG